MVSTIHISKSAPEIKTAMPQDGFFRSFISHPASVGESYWGHFSFALKFASRLLAAGCAALVHAFIPAWFETTASEQIKKLHLEMVNRHSNSD
jgi:hypothetical protein